MLGVALTEHEHEARAAAGSAIKALRLRLGLTQKALAARLGMPVLHTSGRISCSETGRRGLGFSEETIYALDEILDDDGFRAAVQEVRQASMRRRKISKWTDPDDWTSTYREIVIGYRMMRQWSMRRMAREVGVTSGAWGQVEQNVDRNKGGRRMARGKRLREAAVILGCAGEADSRVGRRNDIIARQFIARHGGYSTARHFGRLLGAARVRLCMTTPVLCELSGYSRSTIDKIQCGEVGKASPFALGCVLDVVGITTKAAREVITGAYQRRRS